MRAGKTIVEVGSGSARTVSVHSTVSGPPFHCVLSICGDADGAGRVTVLCGKWERFPREFAKCRRCRKAKYCGKECQSTAWSEGHRFWCSAKDPEEDGERDHHHHHQGSSVTGGGAGGSGSIATAGAGASRAERREARERDRQARAVAAEARAAQDAQGQAARAQTQTQTPTAQAQGQNTIRVNSGSSTATVVPATQATGARRAISTAAGTPLVVPGAPIPSAAASIAEALARTPNPHPSSVLAAALADGTWTYRPGNPAPPAWPEVQDMNNLNMSQTARQALVEAELSRRALARQLTIMPVPGPEMSRVERMEREEREERERMEAGPSRQGQGQEDVDMMID